jgi:DNA-binding response OmpR family regulator
MPSRSRRILCVYDDPDTCETLSTLLGLAGDAVTTTRTAAASAASNSFDLYLIDVRLSNGRGEDLGQKIRESDPRTPIAIYSADARSITKGRLLAQYAQAYLVKPVGLDELEDTIAQLLEGAQP